MSRLYVLQPYYSVLRARLQILKWEAGSPRTNGGLPRLSVAVPYVYRYLQGVGDERGDLRVVIDLAWEKGYLRGAERRTFSPGADFYVATGADFYVASG